MHIHTMVEVANGKAKVMKYFLIYNKIWFKQTHNFAACLSL